MTLTVEDGAGVSGAESYASVAAIDAYWAARTHLAFATTWAAGGAPAKEGAAREASAYVDAIWGAFYRGTRSGYLQGLMWPRTGAMNAAGYALPDLPPELVAAVCELAGRAILAPLVADTEVNGVVKSFTEKIGPLEESTEYSLNGPTEPRYGVVDGILAPILNGSQPGARGGGWNWA